MIFMKTQSNFYLFLIALISAMGGFLFGYDWVVIGGAKPFYEQYFGIANDPVMQGWAMSSALIGCLFGALSAGKLSDRLGRKPILILAAGLFICTAVGTGAVHSFTFFNVFRLVGGFAIGIASSLSPMYIAEIAPAHLRGRFVSINQLTVVLGILTSQIVNWQIAEPVALGATHEMIRESWNGQMGWRWMFWAMTVPAALFFVFSFILPESPRWLASSGKREAALKVFTRMGGKEYAVTELAAIEAASACQTQEGGYRQLLNPAMYKVLTIGVVMAILQQWCGINVIFNYAQEIFMAAGYGVSDVLMNIVVTGITNVIFTILAMFVVDRWGRKALTLIGSFGLAVIYTFMGAAYYFHITGVVLLIIVVMAIACYAMTLATVMWVIISEIFPNRIRGVAMSVCTFALWAACFILTYTFPMLNSGLGAARKTIENRLSAENWEDTEWSRANMICMYARLKDAQEAYKSVQLLQGKLSRENLMTVSPGGIAGAEGDIYSFDGNPAGTAGMAEMLIQNHEGYVEFLPCLPVEWKDGSFKGLCLKGGAEATAEWTNAVINKASLKATADQVLKVKIPQGKKYRVLLNGKEAIANPDAKGLITVDMKRGDLLELL